MYCCKVVWTFVVLFFAKRDEKIAARKRDSEAFEKSDHTSSVEKHALEGEDSPKAEVYLA